VDVGGGIGSTSMLLANAFSRRNGSPPRSPLSCLGNGEDTIGSTDLGLKFIIQDREIVVEMGEKVPSFSSLCSPRVLNPVSRHGAHDVQSCLILELRSFKVSFDLFDLWIEY
jgi:hypothetical protein